MSDDLGSELERMFEGMTLRALKYMDRILIKAQDSLERGNVNFPVVPIEFPGDQTVIHFKRGHDFRHTFTLKDLKSMPDFEKAVPYFLQVALPVWPAFLLEWSPDGAVTVRTAKDGQVIMAELPKWCIFDGTNRFPAGAIAEMARQAVEGYGLPEDERRDAGSGETRATEEASPSFAVPEAASPDSFLRRRPLF